MAEFIKKIISSSLAVILVLVAFASCSDRQGTETGALEGSVDSTEPALTTPDIYDAKGYRKDRLPEGIDYGGQTVDVLYWNNAKNVEYDAQDNGDIINSAIFRRNLRVSDRLGVNFNWIGEKGDYGQRNEFNALIAADLAGYGTYDVISAYSTTIAMAATQGYATDLIGHNDVLSFDMPWWASDLTDMATINGKLYFATGDISTNYLLRMYGTFFNKQLVTDYGLASPYDLVERNDWTVDRFVELASAFTGEGADPVYGLVHDAITVEALFYGSDLKFVEKDEKDVPYLSDSWKGNRAQDLMDKVSGLCKSSSVKNDSSADEKLFSEGSSLFIIYSLDLAMNYLQNGGVDFGIVPIPKFDASQKDYRTTLNYKYSLYMISKGTDIPDIAATTLEALASESYRSVTPDLYETCMKIRYVTDATSQTMIDHIRDGVSFEIGRTFTHMFNYDTYRTIRKALSGTAESGWQSAAASYEKVFRKNLDDLLAAFGS